MPQRELVGTESLEKAVVRDGLYNAINDLIQRNSELRGMVQKKGSIADRAAGSPDKQSGARIANETIDSKTRNERARDGIQPPETLNFRVLYRAPSFEMGYAGRYDTAQQDRYAFDTAMTKAITEGLENGNKVVAYLKEHGIRSEVKITNTDRDFLEYPKQEVSLLIPVDQFHYTIPKIDLKEALKKGDELSGTQVAAPAPQGSHAKAL